MPRLVLKHVLRVDKGANPYCPLWVQLGISWEEWGQVILMFFFMIFCVFHPEKCRDWVRTKPRLASNSRYLFSAKKMASEMLVNDYLSKEIFGCSFQDINQLRLVVPIEM